MTEAGLLLAVALNWSSRSISRILLHAPSRFYSYTDKKVTKSSIHMLLISTSRGSISSNTDATVEHEK